MSAKTTSILLSPDRVLDLVFLGLSGTVLQGTRELEYWGATGPGPGFFPFWTGVVIAIVAVFLFFKKRPTESVQAIEPVAVNFVAGYAALIVAAAGAWSFLGTLVTFALFTCAELIVVGRYRPLRAMVIGCAVAVTVDLIFAVGLQMRLPRLGWAGF